MLRIEGVGRRFANGVEALHDISLRIGAGDFVALLGPSGCGKSTLLRLIAGLDRPDTGRIAWADGRPPAPGELGFVFQDATLLPWATAEANVWLPLRLRGIERAAAAPQIAAALERVGLSGFAQARPRELSGGMRMRVSIARALVSRPRLLLMDEPFAALDEFTRHRLQEDLQKLWRQLGCTVVFVTHSIYEAAFLAQRVVLMTPRPGQIAQDIPADLAAGPQRRLDPAYAELVGTITRALHAALADFMIRRDRLLRAAPALFAVLFLALWEAAVRLTGVPVYLVPGPIAIADAFIAAPGLLLASLLSTLIVTFTALILSCLLGVVLAVAMTASPWARAAIQPWAVALQVTPIVAIAPLIIVWIGDPFAAMVACATIVAFFPVFSNTAIGLTSPPPELLDLFRLNGAGRWPTLRLLRLPAALPYFLAGVRISGGLALVGAVVAEFVAGSGGFASGLAYRILESGYRLQIARMFAALVLLSAAGIAINAAMGGLAGWLLRRRGEG